MNPFGSYGGSANWDYDNTVYWYNGSTNLKWTDTTGADIAIFQGGQQQPAVHRHRGRKNVLTSSTICSLKMPTTGKRRHHRRHHHPGRRPRHPGRQRGAVRHDHQPVLAGVNGMTLLKLRQRHHPASGRNTITGGVNFTSSTDGDPAFHRARHGQRPDHERLQFRLRRR
ncbi:MAG: hypothetical protein U1F77_05260 [Kiritimatiellia bacterium]